MPGPIVVSTPTNITHQQTPLLLPFSLYTHSRHTQLHSLTGRPIDEPFQEALATVQANTAGAHDIAFGLGRALRAGYDYCSGVFTHLSHKAGIGIPQAMADSSAETAQPTADTRLIHDILEKTLVAGEARDDLALASQLKERFARLTRDLLREPDVRTRLEDYTKQPHTQYKLYTKDFTKYHDSNRGVHTVSYDDKTGKETIIHINMDSHIPDASIKGTIRHESVHAIDHLDKFTRFDVPFYTQHVLKKKNSPELMAYIEKRGGDVDAFFSSTDLILSETHENIFKTAYKHSMNTIKTMLSCLKTKECDKRTQRRIDRIVQDTPPGTFVFEHNALLPGYTTEGKVVEVGIEGNKKARWTITGVDTVNKMTIMEPLKTEDGLAYFLRHLERREEVYTELGKDKFFVYKEFHAFAQEAGRVPYENICPKMLRYDQEVAAPHTANMLAEQVKWQEKEAQRRRTPPTQPQKHRDL